MPSPTRSSRPLFTRTGTAVVALGASVLLVAGSLAALAPPAAAEAPRATFVDLGTAADYSVLAGTGVSNTGAATVLAADLGLSPSGLIAGFPPGTTDGTIHDKDPAAELAQEDRQTAYDDAAGQTSTGDFGGDQAGAILKPGVHTSAAAVTNTGTMTLDADGDSGAVFVFQVDAAFSSAAASKIVLTDGALANNVFWQVLGAVSLGAGAKVVGTFLTAGAVAIGEGATVKGRMLTTSTVALANSPFAITKDDLTPPEITIDGGPARATRDASPPISGTTDEPAGGLVTVTVADQTVTTTVGEGGVWSLGTSTLPPGDHDVTASITDPSRNLGEASQVLTVDLTAPEITIDGGAVRATRDLTPTISGTTDQPGDAPVTVVVGGQTLATTADAEGLWTVTTSTLDESPYGVAASVEDEAGNTATASQVLTVDVTTPVVTIDGGPTRSTSDTSPWTYGTTAEQAGSTVVLVVGDQRLTTTTASGGTWGVSAQALPDGAHQVVASITDAAGNRGTATQTLTINASYRPDAAISRGSGSLVGVGTYGSSARQRVSARVSRTVRSVAFVVRVTNRGNVADSFAVRGTPGTSRFVVTYLVGERNVTRAVIAGTYRTGSVRPGSFVRLVMRVSRTAATRAGDRRGFEVRSISSHAATRRDAVAAVVLR